MQEVSCDLKLFWSKKKNFLTGYYFIKVTHVEFMDIFFPVCTIYN